MHTLIPGQHIHIVGISGFGMSAIARILLESGYQVSGSDQKINALSQALINDGVKIYDFHAADNIEGAEIILSSSAVPANNPEVQAAQRLKIPVLHRREFIAEITDTQQTIAIAGTHGKTTTTSMLTHVLSEAGLDPSYIVGGIMKNTNTNAGGGMGEYFVIEADEYDHMFLGLKPHIGIINNVEWDHPDFFKTPQDLIDAFRQFSKLLGHDDLLIVNADDMVASSLADECKSELIAVRTYAVENPAADWWATDIESIPDGVKFMVNHGGVIGPVTLKIPGRHNVYNAMAVITVARHLGVPFNMIQEALLSFAGTGRRSDLLGEVKGVKVISDYAHHPTAIQTTLRTWRDQPNVRHVWAVWQPHTYSRTRTLLGSFLESFSAADHVLVMDIYAAREAFTPGPVAADIADQIAARKHPDARYSGEIFDTAQILSTEVQAGDVVLILSAGDAPLVGQALLDVLEKRGS